MLVFLIVFAILTISFLLGALSVKLFYFMICKIFGNHKIPEYIFIDNENNYGYCSRCMKKVYKNKQGKWM
jgi:hypothetical protein